MGVLQLVFEICDFCVSEGKMAAATAGVIGGNGSSWIQQLGKLRKKKTPKRVNFCSASYSSAVADPYKTLRIQPDASESEVKKAFRQLALLVKISFFFSNF